MPNWLRTWVIVAAIVSGVVLLWISVTLLAVLLALTVLPYWLWRLFAQPRSPRGPVTIEGEVIPREAPAVASRIELREADKARLAATPVWVVWHEHPSASGAGRRSFAVGVCFSEADAQAFVVRSRGEARAPSDEGYTIHGPANPLATGLFGTQRAEILAVILDRLESDSREPIALRIA